MKRYDKTNIKDLKNAIYYSNVHDAQLGKVEYDCDNQILDVKAFEFINKHEINFIFAEVELVLYMHNQEMPTHDPKTIISFSVENDYSYLNNYIKHYNNESALYFVFQMLNGDELHIISNTIEIRL